MITYTYEIVVKDDITRHVLKCFEDGDCKVTSEVVDSGDVASDKASLKAQFIAGTDEKFVDETKIDIALGL